MPRLSEVQSTIVAAVASGKTLREAAEAAGVKYAVLCRWLNRQDSTGRALVRSLDRAAHQGDGARIEGHSRMLRKAREEQEDDFALTARYLKEVLRIRQEGRVPLDCAVKALEMALDELNSVRLEMSVSWAEHPEKARCFGLKGEGE